MRGENESLAFKLKKMKILSNKMMNVAREEGLARKIKNLVQYEMI